MSIDKYADFNGSEVEVIQYVKGWYQILLQDGTTKKVRKNDLSNMREISTLDSLASFTIQGEGSFKSELVSGKSSALEAVAEAISEQNSFITTDSVKVVEDKNHPAADRFEDESGTFVCGECDAEFLTAESLTAHKAEAHEAPLVVARPGSLAASLLNRDKNRSAGVILCEKVATKVKKEAKPTKFNPLLTKICPDCGSDDLTGFEKEEDGSQVNKCLECGWEVKKTQDRDVKLEPDLSRYTVGKGTTASGRQTIDRDDVVANRLRGMQLDDIYQLVADVCASQGVETIGAGARKMETGFGDFKARYSHLNPGMQRMNLGNVLRGILNRLGLTDIPEA